MKLSREQLEGLLQEPTLDHKGKNLYARCPWCGYYEFGISLDDNHVFNCFRSSKCGERGNIYKLLKKLGRSLEFIKDKDVPVFGKLENPFEERAALDMTMPEMKVPLMWKRLYEDEYLISRGFTNKQFEKFEVGRSKINKDYITFLVRREGKLIGYVSRSDKSKNWIDNYNEKQKERGEKSVYLRYDNSSTDFSKTLFGIDEIIENETHIVILTEGIFSKTKTDTNLLLDESNEIKCCATFGAKLSEEQIELLRKKKVKKLIFLFESDVLNKIKRIVSHAASYFKIQVAYLPEGVDPNDMNVVELSNALMATKDWMDFNLSYVK